MPEICRFFGIVIAVFYDDHNPPHFHARYEDQKVTIDINELTVKVGRLPPRVLGLVIEWAALHKDELIKEWELAKQQKPLFPILPLQ
ncbi:MAG: DUF4160 domain-containing protein [bacterium]